MSGHVSSVDAYNGRAECGKALEHAQKIGDYKFRVKHCQQDDAFLQCSVGCVCISIISIPETQMLSPGAAFMVTSHL